MTNEPQREPGDVALAEVIYDWLYPDATRRECEDFADQLLASDWLAADRARVRAEVLAEVERLIRADLRCDEDGYLLNTFAIGEQHAADLVRGMAEAGEPDA